MNHFIKREKNVHHMTKYKPHTTGKKNILTQLYFFIYKAKETIFYPSNNIDT